MKMEIVSDRLRVVYKANIFEALEVLLLFERQPADPPFELCMVTEFCYNDGNTHFRVKRKMLET